MERRRWWHPTPVLLPGKSHGRRSLIGYSPWGCEELDATERLHFHFSLHALEKEMATHSSVLAWRIPGTVEPGGLPSMGSHRVGHDWSDLAAEHGSNLDVHWQMKGCSSANEWIRKLWYIYKMEYYSAIKMNAFESVLMRQLNLESIIHSEVSQKEKHK